MPAAVIVCRKLCKMIRRESREERLGEYMEVLRHIHIYPAIYLYACVFLSSFSSFLGVVLAIETVNLLFFHFEVAAVISPATFILFFARLEKEELSQVITSILLLLFLFYFKKENYFCWCFYHFSFLPSSLSSLSRFLVDVGSSRDGRCPSQLDMIKAHRSLSLSFLSIYL